VVSFFCLTVNIHARAVLFSVVVRVSLSSPIKSALIAVRRLLSQFGYRMKTFSARRMSVIQGAQLESYITSLSLNDLNRILFRCDGEERDDGKNFGAYNLAFYGDLKYCGLQGESQCRGLHIDVC